MTRIHDSKPSCNATSLLDGRLPKELAQRACAVSNSVVDISQDDGRRITIAVATIVVLVGAIVGIDVAIRPKAPFEWQHARAEAMNPQGLSVELTTADKRTTYHDGEPILFVAHFSSTVRYRYKVDVADGSSVATASDHLHISGRQPISFNNWGIACCGSRLVGLDDQPFNVPSHTMLKLEPGRYEIYLTSSRVFKWDDTPNGTSPSSFEVTSNLLKIRVVPAK